MAEGGKTGIVGKIGPVFGGNDLEDVSKQIQGETTVSEVVKGAIGVPVSQELQKLGDDTVKAVVDKKKS